MLRRGNEPQTVIQSVVRATDAVRGRFIVLDAAQGAAVGP
jgi:hypothetical protein